MESGVQIRLFDRRRDPPDWVDLLGPTQCAAFLKDRQSSVSLDADGKPYSNPEATACFVFDRLDTAQQFCEAKVLALPHLRCEIYDAEGLAHPPLMVIVHPDERHREETGSFWSRRRKLIAMVLFLMAPALIWVDMRRANTIVLPTFLAFTCILTGLRFLYWDFALKHRERERLKRLEAHRRMERGDR